MLSCSLAPRSLSPAPLFLCCFLAFLLLSRSLASPFASHPFLPPGILAPVSLSVALALRSSRLRASLPHAMAVLVVLFKVSLSHSIVGLRANALLASVRCMCVYL